MNSVTTLSAECGRGLVRAMLRVEHRVPGFPAVARFLERLAGTVIGQGRDGDAKPRALARSRIREWNEANPRAVIGRIRLPDRDTRRAGHLVRDVHLLPVARTRVIRGHAHALVADRACPFGGQSTGVDNGTYALRRVASAGRVEDIPVSDPECQPLKTRIGRAGVGGRANVRSRIAPRPLALSPLHPPRIPHKNL